MWPLFDILPVLVDLTVIICLWNHRWQSTWCWWLLATAAGMGSLNLGQLLLQFAAPATGIEVFGLGAVGSARVLESLRGFARLARTLAIVGLLASGSRRLAFLRSAVSSVTPNPPPSLPIPRDPSPS